MPTPRQTHTYAELPVSRAAYDEIAGLLRAAGYDHAFMEDGTIDMHGIGLSCGPDDPDEDDGTERSLRWRIFSALVSLSAHIVGGVIIGGISVVIVVVLFRWLVQMRWWN